MLGKQKMTRLTPPRIGLVKMSSTMLYRAKKREIRGRRPSVKIESMVERYLPLLAPVLSRISSPSKFAEDRGHSGLLASSTFTDLDISIQGKGKYFLFTCVEGPGRERAEEERIGWQLSTCPSRRAPPGGAENYYSALVTSQRGLWGR